MVFAYRSLVLISHVVTSVPLEDFKQYLNEYRRVSRLLVITHPLVVTPENCYSKVLEYQSGKLVSKKKYKRTIKPVIIQYILDFMYTVNHLFRYTNKVDIIIGFNCLSVIAGYLKKLFSLNSQLIYYTIDFTPKRFENALVNHFFHFCDYLAIKMASKTWNVSPRIMEGRKKITHFPTALDQKQKVVPIGIWSQRIFQLRKAKIDPYSLVYAGSLSPHQGIDLVIDALPMILKKHSRVTLGIIGKGEHRVSLEAKVKKLNLQKSVKFLGYFEDHHEVEKVLSKGSIALALYSKELAQWSYYADPSKIKSYLACGLITITTDLTHIAKKLLIKKCGLVIPYESQAVVDAVDTLLTNQKQMKQMRKNAVDFAAEFDWIKVLDKAFET